MHLSCKIVVRFSMAAGIKPKPSSLLRPDQARCARARDAALKAAKGHFWLLAFCMQEGAEKDRQNKTTPKTGPPQGHA
jgi:hypothetical protein